MKITYIHNLLFTLQKKKERKRWLLMIELKINRRKTRNNINIIIIEEVKGMSTKYNIENDQR